jgi:hypothetical protein
MPVLKGVTNFLACDLRIGVPLTDRGVENLAPEIGVTLGSRTADLGSFVTVEARGCKTDGVLGEFPEFLVADGL